MDAYTQELIEKLNRTEVYKGIFPKAENYSDGMQILVEKFLEHKKKKTKVFFIGNGGSCAIASHMAADFMKNGKMNACSLHDHAVITCMGNDYGYEYIFSKPLEFLANQDDLIVAVSSSGNSLNIINAIHAAKRNGAAVITFTGFLADNKIKQMGDINVYVPCEKYGMVESIHNLILQQIVDMIAEQESAEM